MKTLLTCLSAIALCAAPGLAQDIAGYHIGNSLTWDSQPAAMIPAYQAEGLSPTVAYHIDSAKTAYYISTHPDGAWDMPPRPVDPYGQWDNALPNYEWDYLTIQSLSGATGNEELQGFSTLIDSALTNPGNADTTYYVYAAWPRQSEWHTLRELWETPYTDFSTNMQFRREYFQRLVSQLQSSYPTNTIDTIPAGEVLARMDTHLINGVVPGYESAWDLYRDTVHMDYKNGRYIAHATTLATILNKPPDQIAISGFTEIDPGIKALADQSIWETLSGAPMPDPPPPPPPAIVFYDPFDSTPTETEGHYVVDTNLGTAPNNTVGANADDWSGEGAWSGGWNHAASWIARENSLEYEQPEAYFNTHGDKLAYNPGATNNMTNRTFYPNAAKLDEGSAYFSFLAEWNGYAGSQIFGLTDIQNFHGGRYEMIVNSNGAKLRLFNDSSTDTEYAPLVTGETNLFVGKVNIDESITVWINPDLTLSEDELVAQGAYDAMLHIDAPEGTTGKPVNDFVATPRTTSSALDLFFDEVRIGTTWEHVFDVEIRGDFNNDGAINGLDIPGFKDALADPAEWTYNFGREADRLGDFNGDGAFNGLDIPGFKNALAGAAVPEPATVLLLTAGTMALARRRRR